MILRFHTRSIRCGFGLSLLFPQKFVLLHNLMLFPTVLRPRRIRLRLWNQMKSNERYDEKDRQIRCTKWWDVSWKVLSLGDWLWLSTRLVVTSVSASEEWTAVPSLHPPSLTSHSANPSPSTLHFATTYTTSTTAFVYYTRNPPYFR